MQILPLNQNCVWVGGGCSTLVLKQFRVPSVWMGGGQSSFRCH